MNAEQRCSRCGKTLPPDAPAGHCPACLVQVAMEAVSVETVASAAPGASQSAEVQPLSSAGSRLKYFGDYELIEEIARGGMGVVWKARQTSLNRPVALKMILAGRFAGEADVRRFHTEAEAAANLQHPNIVAIHEIGAHDGQHYFSMDYIEGKSLAELVSDGPLPAAQAAALVKRIAEAVHYAHQRGTLHRDLKPSNVLIDAEGQPHITDFGLAKQLARESGLTQTGAVLGTPAYMPPEQALGRNDQVGPASDVYSIGAMLYHLLTGRAPFTGATPAATLRLALEEEPVAPAKLNPQTPPDLETICLKCLEKRPDRRYHAARELAEELGRFLAHEPILARPANAWRKAWSWAQHKPWAVVGIASLMGLALVGLAYGLWEQVQYLKWNSLPPGPAKLNATRRLASGNELRTFIGALFLWPIVIYGRFLQDRQRRNLGVDTVQLALLAGSGLLLAALGISCELTLIQLQVWKQSYPWWAFVGMGLGLPFLYCWMGSVVVFQAVRLHHAHWAGVTAPEREWLPRQSLHYSSVAFLAATLLNLGLFFALAYLTTPVWYDHSVFRFNDEPPYLFLWVCFMGVAQAVSSGCWLYARRKVNQVPKPVLVFFWLFAGGSCLTWMAMPLTLFIPMAALAGLLGGFVLAKTVRVRKASPADTLPPLRPDELFEWGPKAFARTLASLVIGLLLLAGLVSRKDPSFLFPFLLFTGLNACLPLMVFAARGTTGRLREFFLVFAILLSPPAILWPLAVILGWTAPGPLFYTPPLGWAAGGALIYCGKLRPRRR